ncbi:MAG: hypothetical protein ACRD08_19410, partial [Acidimicrobiales bacterium]
MTARIAFLVPLRRLLRIGTLVPATIAATAAADLALRTLPPDRYSFRVWEAMRTSGEPSPFRPSHRYHRDDVYGNLAALSNIPGRREYRAQTFTTDALGYHNPPGLADQGAIAAVLFGTSQSAGAEVNDDETLAARLTALTGRSVYNAAAGDQSLWRIRQLGARLGLGEGWIIVEPPEEWELPPMVPGPPDPPEARCGAIVAALDLERACGRLARSVREWRVSPLRIFAQRALKVVQDDRLLPNPYEDLALQARLRNGDTTLFLPLERSRFHEPRSEARAARYLVWLARKLEQHRLHVLVLLVPKKFTVYAPLLDPPEPGTDQLAAFNERLERRLREEGIPVVN